MRRIGFTGTQIGMSAKQLIALEEFFVSLNSDLEFHDGDCVGADSEAFRLARLFGAKTICHPPSNPYKRAWNQHDVIRTEKPYIQRNHDIVNETEELLAAPKEDVEVLRSGTWATIRYARKLGRPIIILQR